MSESESQSSKKGYWEEFYAKNSLAREPSSFAKHISGNGYLKPGETLLDIGCGNGRDSLHFASQGVETLGIDACHAAIEILNKDPHPHVTFRCVDIKEDEFMKLTEHNRYYARFLLHAVTPSEEARIFATLAATKPGTRVFLEFRTVNDPLMQKGEVVSENERIHTHYRRFLCVDKVQKQLAEVGFTRTLLKSEEGNLSITADDNPVLGRIIADKPE